MGALAPDKVEFDPEEVYLINRARLALRWQVSFEIIDNTPYEDICVLLEVLRAENVSRKVDQFKAQARLDAVKSRRGR